MFTLLFYIAKHVWVKKFVTLINNSGFPFKDLNCFMHKLDTVVKALLSLSSND